MPFPQTASPVVPPRLTLVDVAVRELEHLIVTGRLEPGEQLREDELATWLGISRTPVRDALDRLQDLGLVESEPHRGSWVARLDAETLDHTAQAMAGVLGSVARLAWPALSPAGKAQVRAAVHDAGAAAADVDQTDNRARRDTFRAVLAPLIEACANPVLVGIEADLRPSLTRLLYLAPPADVTPEQLAEVCRRLDDAIQSDHPFRVGHAVEYAYLAVTGWTIQALRSTTAPPAAVCPHVATGPGRSRPRRRRVRA
jgi:DNA-binding GntR family transcriptional regulator